VTTKEKNKNSNETDFGKILEAEDSGEKNSASAIAQDVEKDKHKEEEYLKSLKEKIEKLEEEGGTVSTITSTLHPQHKFIIFTPPEESRETDSSKQTPSQQAAPSGVTNDKNIFFQLSEKTTQKLEEEIRKSSSKEFLSPFKEQAIRTPSGSANSIYVLCGPDAGRSFYLTGERIRIGRGMDNEVILKDISVSRRHCILYKEDDKWFVEDRSSDNGTFIDGNPVEKAPLEPGQYLQIGRTILILETSK